MDFIKEFNKKISEKNIDWTVRGLLSANGETIFSLGSDSKLIGRIFEIISLGILKEIADEKEYILEPSASQTCYPDFTLHKGVEDKKKIAIDIKTTYRDFTKKKKELKKFGFTLGSYASFLRDGKKNIAYPYSEYEKHYVIGFIYSRNNEGKEGGMYKYDEFENIAPPYTDVTVFVQEKHKMAGEKPGSGNTENIGSYKTNKIGYLIEGKGPFSVLGAEVFDDYWSNYPKYRTGKDPYSTIDGYLKWKETQGRDVSSLEELYAKWKKEVDE